MFNRKELLITMNFNIQADVREILSANNIPYVIKTTNITNGKTIGLHRGYRGSFGVNHDYSYEYKIYVHKNDYDKAVSLRLCLETTQ